MRFTLGNEQDLITLPQVSKLLMSAVAARSETTITSFIVVRVIPTNSFRNAASSSSSKSISVKTMHAVVDGVGVGQACGELRQGLDLALLRTSGLQRLPAFRDDVCHGGLG